MIALAVDENFNNRIVRGMLRRNQHLDMVRVQDVGLSGAPDQEVLAWAASEHRTLVTHDVATMTERVRRRIDAGLLIAGVIVCSRQVPIAVAIEDLLLIAECSTEGEWDYKIVFLPL
jgi:predicted nuclease of predicted toxin-antitoxin system